MFRQRIDHLLGQIGRPQVSHGCSAEEVRQFNDAILNEDLGDKVKSFIKKCGIREEQIAVQGWLNAVLGTIPQMHSTVDALLEAIRKC